MTAALIETMIGAINETSDDKHSASAAAEIYLKHISARRHDADMRA